MITKDIQTYFADGCGRCSLFATPECKVHTWSSELKTLRQIVLSCGLDEAMKWGSPCYTYNGKNVLMVVAFKNHCAISFFKGALLKDELNLLESPGENSQAVKMYKCTGMDQISKHEDALRTYIFEAIEAEKAGLKIDFKEKDELEYPEELLSMFETNEELKDAFEALTPGRKRGYILHFSQAKQSATRTSRIEKCIPKIMIGKGWNDR